MSRTTATGEEVVRRACALHNQGPEEVLARLDELFDPEVCWAPIVVGGLEGGAYRGHDGLRRYYADRGDAFAKGEVELVSCEAIGEDIVIARVLDRGVGRASGVSLDQEVWSAVWLRDGRVLRWQAFPSRAEAIEAVRA
jgi:ketosteroid isomerase-like protein